IGYALTLDKLINIYSNQDICFVPLKPLLESELNIVWKKNGELSRASKVFLEELKYNFSSIN
ncbi:MAG: hypothetical protein K2M14_05625, partial [Muribaculaceae bacterium]|nr:hypothetical protein [Muribaculaceae bacterium]